LHEFLDGIELYNKHLLNYKGQERLENKVIWQSGSAKLLDYGYDGKAKATIFLIPSIINKPYVFDISKEKSFARFLKEQGFHVFLMDWGSPTEAEYDFNCTDYIEKYLITAFNELEKNTNTPIITIGYCLGGLFAIALAQLIGDRMQGLGLFASPWDFSCDEVWHLPDVTILEQTFDLYKIIPSVFLQSMFLLMSASSIEEKFRKLYSCKDINGFMAIEEWLNDGVDLTVPVAKELFINWVHKNTPFKGEWLVKGKIINPEKITIPTFISIPKNDKIVPPNCSKSLCDIIPNNYLLEQKAGHIGMLIGNKAKLIFIYDVIAEFRVSLILKKLVL